MKCPTECRPEQPRRQPPSPGPASGGRPHWAGEGPIAIHEGVDRPAAHAMARHSRTGALPLLLHLLLAWTAAAAAAAASTPWPQLWARNASDLALLLADWPERQRGVPLVGGSTWASLGASPATALSAFVGAAGQGGWSVQAAALALDVSTGELRAHMARLQCGPA